MEWWHVTIQAILDQYSKYRRRANQKLANSLEAAQAALGMEIPSTELPHDFTVKKARTAITKLQNLRQNLLWQSVSLQDAQIMQTPLDLTAADAPAKIAARWERLSDNAKKLEFSQMAVGFLTGIVEGRSRKKIFVDMGTGPDSEICKWIHRDFIAIPMLIFS